MLGSHMSHHTRQNSCSPAQFSILRLVFSRTIYRTTEDSCIVPPVPAPTAMAHALFQIADGTFPQLYIVLLQ